MGTPFAYLVVDDDADVLEAARLALRSDGVSVEVARSPDGVAGRVSAFDAVLLDMNFALGERSGAAGLAALQELITADSALSVVLMTTYGGIGLAVQAMKEGAADFVLKPWRNEALRTSMAAAVALTRERRSSRMALNLDDLEHRAIARALQAFEGNVSHAATALGLTRPALYRRMERYGLASGRGDAPA